MITAFLIRDGVGWVAHPLKLPCNKAGLCEEHFQETLANFTQEADAVLNRNWAQQRENEEVAAAIAAVASVAEPTLTRDDEQLMESIKVYAENGNFTAAAECQENLIRRLMEYADRTSEGRLQARIAREFTRMDDLWHCIAEPSLVSSQIVRE